MSQTIQIVSYHSPTQQTKFDIPDPIGCNRKQANKKLAKLSATLSEREIRIAQNLGEEDDPFRGVELAATLKNKSAPDFLFSMADYLDAQKELSETHYEPNSFGEYIQWTKRTRLNSKLLAKIYRCVRYLSKHNKPAKPKSKKQEVYQRYKADDLSFTLHWKNQRVESVIVHMKKSPKSDFKQKGGHASVTKALEFTNTSWQYLAERTDFEFGTRAKKPIQKFHSEAVVAPPRHFNVMHHGRRKKTDTESLSADCSKEIVKKNTTYLDFYPCDLNFIKRKFPKVLTPDNVLQILYRVALGLKGLHRKHIVHCDLKEENILIQVEGDKIQGVKLADLDDSTNIHQRSLLHLRVNQAQVDYEHEWAGEKSYWPPDYKKTLQDKTADIYALGKMAGVLLEGMDPQDEEFKRSLKPIIDQCIAPKPEERLTAQEAEIKFLTQINLRSYLK